ncbi:MAG: FliH/SctL family protein [Planctomycetota bacterium]|nr:FliH/SctL family protein [Planctomycetota bacterium]
MSRLIKGASDSCAIGASPLNLESIEREAAAVIAAAQARAREIIKAAMVESERLKQAAAEQGIQEGRKAGTEAGVTEGRQMGLHETQKKLAAESGGLLKLQAELVKGLEEKLKFAEKGAKLDLIRLAISIAERIVKKEVKIDPSVLQANVARAVDLIGKKQQLVVSVNPSDLAAAEKLLPGMLRSFEGVDSAKVESDPGVASGGCIVRSGTASVNADIATQLGEIERILLG